MSADDSARTGPFRAPLPDGFCARVVRVGQGCDLGVKPGDLPDAIVLVEQGVLEVECRAGACRRFGRGSMIPIARLPVARLRNVGDGPLVLVAVSRAPVRPTDEFPSGAGSYCDS